MTEPLCSDTKRCPRCCEDGEERSVLCFSSNRTRPDGLNAWCRACQSEHDAANRKIPETVTPMRVFRHYPKKPHVPRFEDFDLGEGR